MDCYGFLHHLDALTDHELPGNEATQCRDHVAACPQCAAAHGERVALKQLVHSRAARPTLPPGLEDRIRSAVMERSLGRRKRLLQTAAALLIIGLGCGFLLNHISAPRLSHAAASAGCATAFENVLAQGAAVGADLAPTASWEDQVRQVLAEELDIHVERLPEIHAAIFQRWQPEDIGGVHGVRVDFRPDEVSLEGPENSLISLFLLPLHRVALDSEERVALASLHVCSCTRWKTGSIVCYTQGGVLVSVVSNVGAEHLQKHVTGR